MPMKRLSLLICLLMLMGLLTACQQTPAAQPASASTFLMGFSQLGSESSWRLGNTRSIQDAARRHGVNLMLENANQKQEKQIDAIRSFIAYRVDVIAFSPIVETGWDNVLSEAKSAGIPVILVDRMVATDDDSLYTAYVGADFMQEGALAAEYLLKKADDLGTDNLHIVEITGTVDSTPMRERQTGFWQALEPDGRFTLLESISGDFLRSKGEECMQYLLDTYGGQIDVLYSHNDAMTLGAISAIEAAGMSPGKDIIIISVDGEQAMIDLLTQGRVNCVVECTPHLGDIVMEMAQQLVDGKTIAKETNPEERSFTEYDDLTALEPRGY